ncbi:unnamed protein product [Allacma fusca]|uniref:CDC20/Fizzy WD40 domain-containing protein n=1 Tax=Allacma fusca TaxID=39272 RepID=A0A8J2PK47_9HEXA|nr:unnamed protein product [Allacma fusca]
MASKKTFNVLRKPAESSGSSFQMSMNASVNSNSINLNMSSKTPRTTPSVKPTKTPKRGKGVCSSNKSKPKGTKTPSGGDRFIAEKPNVDMAHYLLQQPDTSSSKASETNSNNSSANNESLRKNENSIYSRSLTENVLGVPELSGTRVLSFQKKPKIAPEGYQNALKVVYLGTSAPHPPAIANYRVIPKSAERVLDAPDIVDDFYLNVLDWSSSNVVGIALKDQVYLWTAHTAEIIRLPCDVERGVENVCALTFLQSGSHIVTSLDRGIQQIWDIEQVKIIRNLRTDETNCRIAALGMHSNLLVSGNRSGTLRFHDLRVQKHEVATIRKAHTQEICGVKWSPDGRFCATGGNDNTIHIWDAANISSTATPVCSFTEHLAAIKALCWSPCRQGILASGGGTNDRTIKIWNVSTSRMLKSVDAESQVSGLLWHEGYREIVSSHGFSKHHLAVWKYPDMTKAGDMTGHSLRVLSMALSPDETTVVSVSADETLRFWRVFPPTKSMTKKKAESISGLKTMQYIR